MRFNILILAVLSAAVPALLKAQEASPTPTQIRRGIWRAELPGGVYIVRLSAISSLSIHEYVVDAAASVTEVNIGTSGSESVRFYAIEANLPQLPTGAGQKAIEAVQDRAKDALARTGVADSVLRVVKNYPATTHARTVEFRLADKQTLRKLFNSAESAWLNNQPGTFKP